MKTYPKLPPKFKSKWVKALRSGKYKQGDCVLKGEFESDEEGQMETRYCCLGVACSVAGIKINGEPAFIQQDKKEGVSNVKRIPKILIGDDGNIVTKTLAEKNDSGKWNFERIADWIEKHL
jgi:hypothetical protein